MQLSGKWTEKSGQPRSQAALALAYPLTLELQPNSPEDLAVCKFFSTYVFVPRHHESVRGFLDCLPLLFSRASSTSMVALATTAISLIIVGGNPSRRVERTMARHISGKALMMVHGAIEDPEESIKDDTLMAVLLLGLYERLHATGDGCSISFAHDAGAVALIKHRGKLINTRSSIATTLLNAVHTLVVDRAAESTEAPSESLAVCLEMISGVPQNAAVRLTTLNAQLAYLRNKHEMALEPRVPLQEVFLLLDQAVELNVQLLAWTRTLPEDWEYAFTDKFDIPSGHSKHHFVYQDRIDVYFDLSVATTWNSYRVTRLRVLTIILSCIERIPGPLADALRSQALFARKSLQELVDDICGSVPFHLGTKICPGTDDRPDVEYPYIARKAGQELRRSCAGLGGWELIEPHYEPLKNALMVNSIRAGQKGWIIEQLARIGRLYALPPNPRTNPTQEGP